MALSPKQQVFVEEYLATWNATEAARRAGYSEKTAKSIGHENLTKPDIADEIRRRVADKAMTADEVLVRLAEQARNEHGSYIRPDGTVDLAGMLRDGKGHLIKGFKESKRGAVIVEFYDAQSALVHIGKHHKLFTDNVAHSGNLNMTEVSVYIPDNGRNDRD